MATSSSTQQKLPLIIFLLAIVANNPLIILVLSAGTSFDLIHVDRLAGRQHLSEAERMEQMLRRDMIRMTTIQRAVGPTTVIRRQTEESNTAVMPISSARDFLSGEYFTELTLGTPPQTLSVVLDTGSDLNWVDCNNSLPVFFDKAKSTSYENVTCSSTTCQIFSQLISVRPCSGEYDPCFYDYTYTLGSVDGDVAIETLTFGLTNGTNITQGQVKIGCTSTRPGLDSLFGGELSGIMGLSNGLYSILTQTENLFQKKFSYCLVDFESRKNESGKLYLGSPPPPSEVSMQSTKLAGNSSGAFDFHGVFVESISIGGNSTGIPSDAWDFKLRAGGTILDSGTTLTRLINSSYRPLVDALNNALSSQYDTTDNGSLPNCYTKKDKNSKAVALPDMVIHFVGGAKLLVPEKNYFFDDIVEGVKCLALDEVVDDGGPDKIYNVIGNMWQQSHLWMFDVINADLKFGPSTCT